MKMSQYLKLRQYDIVFQDKEETNTFWQRPENSPSPKQSPKIRQASLYYFCKDVLVIILELYHVMKYYSPENLK